PLRACVEIKRAFRRSTLTQRIMITRASARIDFDTEVDWHETHLLLKAAFPVAVRASRATFDIQWGQVDRPTHRNTSWDAAQFEVPAQKWADLSEGDFGVALLNDCKYGYDIHCHVMRLSLIKSATMPDVGADQGPHAFTYALLPHAGGWQGEVQAAAAALNHPVRVTGGAERPPFVACAQPNVVIETLKPADFGPGFVLRLYESHRIAERVSLQLPNWVRTVERCNLMEDVTGALDVVDATASFDLAPFEIVTLKCS
ncbi:MAG: glycoside hydrolase family 38 C-terminal domain-containing protein, partial [Pseudomonadota bacterium]